MSAILRPEINIRYGQENHLKPIAGSGYRLNINHRDNRHLRSWWILNERTGMMHDVVRGGIAASNTMNWASGTSGLVYTGSPDYTKIGKDPLIFNQDFTFILRVYLASYNGYRWVDILRKAPPGGNGWLLRANNNNNNKISLIVDGPGCNAVDTSLNTVYLNRWNVIAGCFSWVDKRAHLFIDELERALHQGSGSAALADDDLYVMGQPSPTYDGSFVSGTVSYLMLYDQALPLAQIRDLYWNPYGTPGNPRLIFDNLSDLKFGIGTGSSSAASMLDRGPLRGVMRGIMRGM